MALRCCFVAIIYRLVIAGLVAGAVLLHEVLLSRSVSAGGKGGSLCRPKWSGDPVGLIFEFAIGDSAGIFTATVVSRLRFLGVRAAGELDCAVWRIAASSF